MFLPSQENTQKYHVHFPKGIQTEISALSVQYDRGQLKSRTEIDTFGKEISFLCGPNISIVMEDHPQPCPLDTAQRSALLFSYPDHSQSTN
jgi:hypothetical protein